VSGSRSCPPPLTSSAAGADTRPLFNSTCAGFVTDRVTAFLGPFQILHLSFRLGFLSWLNVQLLMPNSPPRCDFLSA